MLDIGIVIPQLEKYGGAERLLVECLSRWQHKHRLTVYAMSTNRAMLEEHGVGNGVKCKKLSPQVSDNAYTFLLNASFIPKVWSYEIGRHDVFNTHLWPMHLLDIAPAVWYPHEPLRMLYDLRSDENITAMTSEEERKIHIYPKYNYDTVNNQFFQPMLRATESFDSTGKPYRVVANSKYCASYLSDVYGINVNRVVYPGVTVDDFLPPMGSEYILTVAQLWPHKRIRLILQSLRLLDDIHLYIVGSGPEKENLIREAKELGVYDRTFFLSGLNNHELQIVFSRALAVVFMPVREPFGIVALEAMAASKPLIAVHEGGYVEVVDEGSAMLIPPHVDALAEKIDCLRQHPELCEAMGRHGKELAKQYTWDRTAAELLEEIEQAHAAWQEEHALTVQSDRRKTLVGAHYYGWYGDGLGSAHWNDTKESGIVTEMPSLGYYASTSADSIEQHLRMAENIGLDFFVFNLHVDHSGISSHEWRALGLMLNKAEHLKSPVKVCVQLCFYNASDTDLERVCELLKSSVFIHPSYQTADGLPIVSVFWTGQFDGDRPLLRLLRQELSPSLLMASSLRMYPTNGEYELTYGTFDGWSLFSPLELSAPERWEYLWSEAYANASSGAKALRCVTVSPGYDDTALTSSLRVGNSYRKIPREAGGTYRRMWEFVLSLPEAPDMVFISTFNEFHENTHIEPTQATGARYLDMTRDFIQQGRAKWTN